MNYTVILPFSPDGKDVLMQMLKNGPHAGMFYGLIGTSETNRSAVEASLIMQRWTGVVMQPQDLDWVFTIEVPERGWIDGYHFYSCIVHKEHVVQMPECAGAIVWMPPQKLQSEPELFLHTAGIRHAVNRTMEKRGFTRGAPHIIPFSQFGSYT